MNKDFNIGQISELRPRLELPTLDFLLSTDEAQDVDFTAISTVELVTMARRVTSSTTCIEVRTTKAACWRFDTVEAANTWITNMREKFGKACPTYAIYRVTTEVTSQAI